MRYRLRTLLILLAVGPPVLAGTLWLYLAYYQAVMQREHLVSIAALVAIGGVALLMDILPMLGVSPWRDRD